MARDMFDEHFCLAIFPQGKWKMPDKVHLLVRVKEAFFNSGGHGSCHICCTCPICRSFEEMFDPNFPNDVDKGCKACRPIFNLLQSKLGKTDGIILFSHNRPVPKETIDALLKEKKVKKVFILESSRKKTETFDITKLNKLPIKVIGIKDFMTYKVEMNTIVEVRKEEYLK